MLFRNPPFSCQNPEVGLPDGIRGFADYHGNLYPRFESNEILSSETVMRAAVAIRPLIRVAVVESDPLRFVGFQVLCSTDPDLELISASLTAIGSLQQMSLILLA